MLRTSIALTSWSHDRLDIFALGIDSQMLLRLGLAMTGGHRQRIGNPWAGDSIRQKVESRNLGRPHDQI
jgi:hypothetical protein